MLTFLIGVLLILAIFSILILWLMNRRWWKIPFVRNSLIAVPVVGVISILLMIYGFNHDIRTLIGVTATLASFCFIVLIATTVSLPLSGLVNITASILAKRQARKQTDVDPESRRRFLSRTAAVLPATALGLGTVGLADSFSDVKIFKRELKYRNLPESLDGISILHLSDLHLGRYFGLSNLRDLAARLDEYHPDIVLLTGDICDVVSQLPDTIRIVHELNPRYGTYASIGNHEYYHGVEHARKVHSQSPVPLLINEGLSIQINGTAIFIGGADDPRFLRGDDDSFLRDTVDRTLSHATTESFKILMSHRPRGFVRAAELGVDLTLSGHTHGGQIGIGGRSIFESDDPPNYFWGHYENGESQLYTSSGVGHWFPFRLGCPAEAPLLVLKKG